MHPIARRGKDSLASYCRSTSSIIPADSKSSRPSAAKGLPERSSWACLGHDGKGSKHRTRAVGRWASDFLGWAKVTLVILAFPVVGGGGAAAVGVWADTRTGSTGVVVIVPLYPIHQVIIVIASRRLHLVHSTTAEPGFSFYNSTGIVL